MKCRLFGHKWAYARKDAHDGQIRSTLFGGYEWVFRWCTRCDFGQKPPRL